MHKGEEQMAVRVKHKVADVRVEQISRNDFVNSKNRNNVAEYATADGKKIYVLFELSNPAEKKLIEVVGKADLEKKSFSIYHYQTLRDEPMQMLPEYSKYLQMVHR